MNTKKKQAEPMVEARVSDHKMRQPRSAPAIDARTSHCLEVVRWRPHKEEDRAVQAATAPQRE
jgi:hypothetical protein